MVQIINISEETLQNIPHIFERLYKLFGTKTIALLAVVVDNEIGFIGRDGGNCVYITKNGCYPFTINLEEDLYYLEKDNFKLYFDNGLCIIDENNIEQHISLEKLDEPDNEEYDGTVSYRQYNPANDTLCEIRYQHMYREIDGRPIIYGYHTRKVDYLFIDEDYTKKGKIEKGVLPSRSKYYSRVEFDDDTLGYKLAGIREYGLLEFLEKGPYNLQMGREVVRYSKVKYIDDEGNYHDFWPLNEQIKNEDLEEMIKSYGFRTEIPWQLIEMYNGRDNILNTILEIVKQMKVISKEVKESDESSKVAILTLKNE